MGNTFLINTGIIVHALQF